MSQDQCWLVWQQSGESAAAHGAKEMEDKLALIETSLPVTAHDYFSFKEQELLLHFYLPNTIHVFLLVNSFVQKHTERRNLGI